MRETDGRNEVLVVTYVNGDIEEFPDAVATDQNASGSGRFFHVVGSDRTLAVLFTASVRKFQWVEA